MAAASAGRAGRADTLERLGATRRSLRPVPAETIRTLFHERTTSDYTGQGRPEGSWAGNLHHARERPPLCGWGGASEDGAESTIGSSVAEERPALSLTAYAQHFRPWSLEGSGMDRELKTLNKARGRGQPPAACLPTSFETSYSSSFTGRKKGDAEFELECKQDHRIGSLISPGADTATVQKLSYAASQHLPPPKDWGVLAERCGPSHHLYRLPKAADFYQTESHRQFTHPAGVLPRAAKDGKQKALSRLGSAPGGFPSVQAALEELGPDRTLRQATMSTQYSLMSPVSTQQRATRQQVPPREAVK